MCNFLRKCIVTKIIRPPPKKNHVLPQKRKWIGNVSISSIFYLNSRVKYNPDNVLDRFSSLPDLRITSSSWVPAPNATFRPISCSVCLFVSLVLSFHIFTLLNGSPRSQTDRHCASHDTDSGNSNQRKNRWKWRERDAHVVSLRHWWPSHPHCKNEPGNIIVFTQYHETRNVCHFNNLNPITCAFCPVYCITEFVWSSRRYTWTRQG